MVCQQMIRNMFFIFIETLIENVRLQTESDFSQTLFCAISLSLAMDTIFFITDAFWIHISNESIYLPQKMANECCCCYYCYYERVMAQIRSTKNALTQSH